MDSQGGVNDVNAFLAIGLVATAATPPEPKRRRDKRDALALSDQ